MLSHSFYLEFYLWKIFEVRIEAALFKEAFEFAFASYLRMLANWYDCITSLKLRGLQMDHEFKCMWKFAYNYILLGKFWNKKLFSLFLSVNREWRLLGGWSQLYVRISYLMSHRGWAPCFTSLHLLQPSKQKLRDSKAW